MSRKTIIIIAIIIIAGGGIFYWIYQSNSTPPETPQKTPQEKQEEQPSIPSSYYIEDPPYYGEENWCWGASSLMLLMGAGFIEEEVQEARTAIKTEGRGGPPDMFIGFEECDLVDDVRIAYSKDYVEEYADFYNQQLLVDPDEQTMLFDNRDQAFECLKTLISSDVLVMLVVHNGNHFVVATGYDQDYIYTNDPGWDNAYDYKIDSDPNLEQRRIYLEDFLGEWSISGQESEIGGRIGFPGDCGMIWLEVD